MDAGKSVLFSSPLPPPPLHAAAVKLGWRGGILKLVVIVLVHTKPVLNFNR